MKPFPYQLWRDGQPTFGSVEAESEDAAMLALANRFPGAEVSRDLFEDDDSPLDVVYPDEPEEY